MRAGNGEFLERNRRGGLRDLRCVAAGGRHSWRKTRRGVVYLRESVVVRRDDDLKSWAITSGRWIRSRGLLVCRGGLRSWTSCRRLMRPGRQRLWRDIRRRPRRRQRPWHFERVGRALGGRSRCGAAPLTVLLEGRRWASLCLFMLVESERLNGIAHVRIRDKLWQRHCNVVVRLDRRHGRVWDGSIPARDVAVDRPRRLGERASPVRHVLVVAGHVEEIPTVNARVDTVFETCLPFTWV